MEHASNMMNYVLPEKIYNKHKMSLGVGGHN